LRLLSSLRLLRFLMPGNHSVCKVHAVFSFLEAKEAVEVIEASDVIMSVRPLKFSEPLRVLKSII
jgi:hypothetical protein